MSVLIGTVKYSKSCIFILDNGNIMAKWILAHVYGMYTFREHVDFSEEIRHILWRRG